MKQQEQQEKGTYVSFYRLFHMFSAKKKNLKIQSLFANQLGNFPEHLAKLNILGGRG